MIVSLEPEKDGADGDPSNDSPSRAGESFEFANISREELDGVRRYLAKTCSEAGTARASSGDDSARADSDDDDSDDEDFDVGVDVNSDEEEEEESDDDDEEEDDSDDSDADGDSREES